jgi:hypothetical protein
MIRAVIALLTALMLQGSAAAQAQRRAIVIGIGEYRELQGIVRPVGDARAVHDRLSQLGFTAGLVVNADGPALQDAFNRFTASLQDGDVAASGSKRSGLATSRLRRGISKRVRIES